MRSIMLTYPGFQSLPQGLKKLLLESETFFFSEAQARALQPGLGAAPTSQWEIPYTAAVWDRWQPTLSQPCRL